MMEACNYEGNGRAASVFEATIPEVTASKQ